MLRAADAASAAGLSAMAQGIGYTGACLGPLIFGLAHEVTGGWGRPRPCSPASPLRRS
ncbi:hypothetical protein ACU4GR_17930 [Methylobacterium oryzae CBMB20]